jgi:oligopeptide/dipeptide ABC transporter ATP-binding protein
MVVSSQVAEAFRPNGANGLRDRAADLLARFGLGRREAQAYPHQLSGGMRQRVLVAMGLAPEPRLMIADEPTKGIDHQRVREVERLFHRLKEQNPEMALLIVTHDLDFARTMADRVAVMYAGRLVEIGLKDRFFIHPLHPYSRALLEAAPSGGLKPIRGQAPGVDEEFPGCPFAPRCDLALPGCLDSFPPTAGQSGEMVYCWRHAWSGSRQ